MVSGTCLCGATAWRFDGEPGAATACNCTLCRRYGVLWAYDFENERISLSGATSIFTRADQERPGLEIHFCPTCACVLAWRGLRPRPDGQRRMAVNLRLAPPEAVADIPIDHFGGLDRWEDLPRDGRCVRDLWF